MMYVLRGARQSGAALLVLLLVLSLGAASILLSSLKLREPELFGASKAPLRSSKPAKRCSPGL